LAYEGFISKTNSKKTSEINQEYLKTKLEKLTEIQENILKQNEGFRKSLDVLTNNQSSSEARGEAANKVITEIENITKDNSSNLINFDFTQLIERYKEYLSILSIEQLCFVINITTSLLMLSCLFSIFLHIQVIILLIN
jgi:hypothetical protein